MKKSAALLGILLSAALEYSRAFVPSSVSYQSTHSITKAPFIHNYENNNNVHSTRNTFSQIHTSLFMAVSGDIPEDISSMRIGELKKELESLGISTKAMLEKKELVEALVKARTEGRQPVTPPPSSSASSGSNSSSSTSTSRADKIAAEMEKLKSMSVGEMRKELQSLEISTKTFFEKSEFIKALAEARVDGVKSSSEAFDPSYKDVVVQKMNAQGARGGKTIDVKLG